MKARVFLSICLILLAMTACVSMFISKDKMALDVVDEITLQKIVEIKETQDNIYKGLKEYVQNNIKKVETDFTYDDVGKKITGQGSIFLFLEATGRSVETFFDFTFEVKDQKYRITLTNIYAYSSRSKPDRTVKEPAAGKENLSLISNAIYDTRVIGRMNDCIIKDNIKSNW